MRDELENKVLWLFPEITETKTARELYCMGYKPRHQTFRKRMEGYEICYRQRHKSDDFEVGAIIRCGVEA
jgi:hypothetical protein